MVYVEGEEEDSTKDQSTDEVIEDSSGGSGGISSTSSNGGWKKPTSVVNATAISSVIGNALRSGRLSILKASPSFPVNVERKLLCSLHQYV